MNKEEKIDKILKRLKNHDFLSLFDDTYLLTYIKVLQQENNQLKDKLSKIFDEVEWVGDLINSCDFVDTNAITIYKIIKGDKK